MALPFQRLVPLGKGSLFCAARGCSIHTFDLSASPQLLSSWTHPQAQSISTPVVQDTTQKDEQQPPSKRRKLDSEAQAQVQEEEGEQETPSKNKKKANNAPPKPESPLIVLLAATDDGNHVIAVTGQDKTLWVFEHDGKGLLKQLSQRVMPKRPSSLAFTADGQTILSADKFGDVYALPLIESSELVGGDQPASSPAPAPPTSSTSTSTPTSTSKPPPRGANVFTVHSQRNRRALEDQQRQRENNAKLSHPKEGPKFAHDLLLGHVSMLTSVVTASDGKGRPYILTADRDEHIRVSRGVPQTHVIETYCHGHASFVNSLCVPTPATSRQTVLVSGGGDAELFVWDWLAGKLLSTTDLLSRVREVQPETTKIAVVKIISWRELGSGECYLAVICERVPALFIFQLQADNTLTSTAALALRGNALDVITLGQSLLVSIDAAADGDGDGDGEVSIFEHNEKSWIPRSSVTSTGIPGDQAPLTREELDKALYTVENLRKTDLEHEGGDDGDA
ncbi:hypothetical protein GGR50DRAFT_692078 [Xylaria sp. CBS 124048]|nr:hypothetical protein GGR50DRAFT_692078 [Xylaria sp. CBS 124048]